MKLVSVLLLTTLAACVAATSLLDDDVDALPPALASLENDADANDDDNDDAVWEFAQKRTIPKGKWLRRVATSFADPQDLVGFKKCKKTGKSDEYCFHFGDNGLGYWGAKTATTKKAYVALDKADLLGMFGSMKRAKNKKVEVRCGKRLVKARIGDLLGTKHAEKRVDLNPGAYTRLGKQAPVWDTSCEVRWV